MGEMHQNMSRRSEGHSSHICFLEFEVFCFFHLRCLVIYFLRPFRSCCALIRLLHQVDGKMA